MPALKKLWLFQVIQKDTAATSTHLVAYLGVFVRGRLALSLKLKLKEADLYSAFIEVPYTQGAHTDHTVLPANYTVPASTS